MIKPNPSMLIFLDILTTLLIAIAAALVFFYAPVEAVMGAVQKVFYFHVASLWVGMLGFLVAAAASIFYLHTNRNKWDLIAVSSIEISLVFFFTGIITGSIWARPVWNTWWTWDPRLTSAAIVELVYTAYFILRQSIESPEKQARFAAVYAIAAFVSVPITFISIRLLRTIHPVVIGNITASITGTFDMMPAMLQTFFVSLLAFSFLFVDLLWHRIRLGELRETYDAYRIRSMNRKEDAR
jgi:heme exporter protein C